MRDKRRIRAGVADLAAQQHGLVTTRQLGQLGWSRERISRAAASERLHQIHQGVYAVGHPTISAHGKCLAAVLACGDDALLSHGSAGWLWGLLAELWIPIEVMACSPRRCRDRIRVHNSERLRKEDRRKIHGVPVTSVPSTLLHLAGTRKGLDPGRLLGRAEKLGRLDIEAIDSLLAASAGQRGVARLRLAVDEFREPVFVRSRLERRFRRLVRDAGLPLHSSNFFVAGYELDAYWPELRFAVEIDTYDYHGDKRAFEEDRKRQEELKLAGIEMVRITGRRITDEPQAVAASLRALLNQRAHELSN
jgi:very-short-patch-repair endonuclease